MNPTAEQSAILDLVQTTKTNIMIRARAGCGKTSTLELIDSKSKAIPHLLLCFNKSIAIEAQKRMRSTTTVKTFNSLGHKIWADYCHSRPALEPKKIYNIYKAIMDDLPRGEAMYDWPLWDSVRNGVDLARSLGYIPDTHAKAANRLIDFETLERYMDETPLPEARAYIDRVLNICIKQSYEGKIDFNDQVYMPALFGGLYPTFPTVLIDEYQDLSPVNSALVAKLCRQSRIIGVGDEAQAIYEFRGADANSMPNAVEKFSMKVLPLTVSFRCPDEITRNVQWHVPDIQSFRSGGTIIRHGDRTEIRENSTVICRYNAPLLHLAMQMAVKGKKVDVAGVDIGAKIIKQLNKLGSETMTQTQVLNAIDEWQAERESLDSKTAADTAASMRVFARHGRTLAQAIAYAKHIFESSDGMVKFMSGHKAKGLEFDHVYHLNADKIKVGGQEQNIHYVIDTRPKETLTYISEGGLGDGIV